MPNKSPGPFEGKKVVFQTTEDVNDIAGYGGVDRVAAVLPGTSPEEIQSLKNAGYSDVVLWDPNPSLNTASEAKRLGVDGVIVQAEGPGQMQGSDQAAAGLVGTGVTIGMVTNNYMAQYPPYVDVAMPEAYTDSNSNATVDNMIASSRARGAPPTIMPVVGGDAPSGGGASVAAQQAATAASQGGYGVFASPGSSLINNMLAPPITTGGTPRVSASVSASASASATAAQAASPQIQAHFKESNGVGQQQTPQPQGLNGPHQAAGTDGAPPAYTGGAAIVDDPNNPNDTFSFIDKEGRKVTITTTASGVKVEQVEDEKPYRISAPDDWNGNRNSQPKEPAASSVIPNPIVDDSWNNTPPGQTGAGIDDEKPLSEVSSKGYMGFSLVKQREF